MFSQLCFGHAALGTKGACFPEGTAMLKDRVLSQYARLAKAGAALFAGEWALARVRANVRRQAHHGHEAFLAYLTGV